MAGLGRGERDLDGLAVAHLADEDDLWRLAERRSQSRGEGRGIAVQLPLVHGALLVGVQELDRILDGDDVLGARRVDQVDDGRQRRGLARSGRPRHEDDAVLERRDFSDRLRQAELAKRRNPLGNQAHHDGERAALPEDVDAEARELRNRVREIAGALLEERPQDEIVAADQIARQWRRCPRDGGPSKPGTGTVSS